MERLMTYYDVKAANSSRIFESEEVMGMTATEISEAERLHDEIMKMIKEGNVDEGLFGSLVGATAGALVGPAIGRAVCRALGVDENGALGKLLTSRLVTAAMGAALGR
jgi:cation transporter-like permease